MSVQDNKNSLIFVADSFITTHNKLKVFAKWNKH